MERKLKEVKNTKPVKKVKSYEVNGLPSGWKLEEAIYEEQKKINRMLDEFERK